MKTTENFGQNLTSENINVGTNEASDHYVKVGTHAKGLTSRPGIDRVPLSIKALVPATQGCFKSGPLVCGDFMTSNAAKFFLFQKVH